MNNLKVASALRLLAEAFETPAETGDLLPVQPGEPVKQTRGRGRPVKGEETAAAAASAPVSASSPTTPTPAAVEADPFATTPAAPVATLEEVRKALTALKTASTQEIALAVLKDTGKADNITELKPENYGAVAQAAALKQAEYTKAPAPEVDPFEVSTATPAAEAKKYTLEDVKAAAVAAGKFTSQATVQKVVMEHGGKATGEGGVVGPSLKALEESQYGAVIAAIQALPKTK